MDYRAIVERLYELNRRDMNDWEKDFITDLYETNYCDRLTDRQASKILEINDRYGKQHL